MSGIGHNGGPPVAPRNFKRRWAAAIFAHPDKPMGAVAMAFKLYDEMGADGSGAAVSDKDFADACGVSERACQNFKRWLLAAGFVVIEVKGHKGRSNIFRAIIPGGLAAPDAVNAAGSPAPIAGNNCDDRHVLPEIESELTAPIAGKDGLAAPDAVNAPSRALVRARIETPSGLVISNSYPTTTTVEQEPARGGRRQDADFPGLNGTAVELIAFIGTHAFVDEHVARRMLKTNIQAFGIDAMLEAYSVTLAEMGGKGVAAPYKFLMGCARNAKARGTQPKGLKGTARTMEIARKLAAQGGAA